MTATKKRPPVAKPAPRTKRRVAADIREGIDELRRHFAGEKTGVRISVASGQASGCIRQLAAARESAGLSLADVATRSGLRAATLAKLEAGETPNPPVDTLSRYAAAVGFSLQVSAVPLPTRA